MEKKEKRRNILKAHIWIENEKEPTFKMKCRGKKERNAAVEQDKSKKKNMCKVKSWKKG